MAIPKITGAQRDFSGGELDVAMKRADDNARMKIGARQLLNWRVLNSGAAKNRPGRSALFLETGRVEKVLMSPGNQFYLAFGNHYLRVYNAAGTQVFSSTLKGDALTPIPWTTASVKNISFVVAAGSALTIYICYGDDAPINVPQILTWDGVSQTSSWTLTTFAETIASPGGQKRTIFDRISPQNVTMLPSGTSGTINLTFSSPVLVSGMIGTRMTFCGRQLTIQSVTASNFTTPVAGPSQWGTALVDELLPPGENIGLTNPQGNLFVVGAEIIGSVSGAVGIITSISATLIKVQILPNSSGNIPTFAALENIISSSGVVQIQSVSLTTPNAVAIWDDEVMNLFRGYPKSVFYDQNRLGFCNFPSRPDSIAWSAIGLPLDMYVAALGSAITPSSAIFEIAPGKSQVLFVLPSMQSSEFVFCDNAIYFIPITTANPLVPGSVVFSLLSSEGCMANVRPQQTEQSILYMKAGSATMGAIQAPGAYNRPYIVDNVSTFHSHLFTASPAVAIAIPSTTSQFEEYYAYVLLANGTIVVGKYAMRQGLLEVDGQGNPKIGWLPWSGAGSVEWISALGTSVVFTTNYSPNGIAPVSVVEALDDTQYLDSAFPVNAAPAPFAPPVGKGPLWWLANGAVTLMDQSTRMMGTYQIDANGNIIPQGNAGENLSISSLVAGQPWTAILEPFVPDANPGNSVHQRMFKRRVSRMAAYVSQSTGFLMARLFSGPLTRTSPALGTVMNTYRVTTWNQDDDPTQPPPLREEAQRWRPIGRAFDPRVAIIKDTPGSLVVHEIGLEASI